MSLWVKIIDKRPPKYDLLEIRDKCGKIQVGWWNGKEFDYYQKRINEPVEWALKTEFKRKKVDEYSL